MGQYYWPNSDAESSTNSSQEMAPHTPQSIMMHLGFLLAGHFYDADDENVSHNSN